MALWERISRQLSNPTGVGGQVIRRLMNRGNAGMNEAAIERLEVVSGSRILDVGFGGGVTFRPLLELGATVTGVDRSADAVAAAGRSNREAVASGRLDLRQGEVEALPFADGSFDGVVTVNTIYFWPDLGAGLTEIRRVLRPGGHAVIAIRDGSVMRNVSRDIFTLRSPAEVLAAIEDAGFLGARLESPEGGLSYHLLSASCP